MGRGRGFEYDSQGYNRHHRYPKDLGGNNHPDNIEVMEVVKHRAHHILFNNQAPIEQLITTYRRAIPILQEEAREDIGKLLELWRKEGVQAYDPKIIK